MPAYHHASLRQTHQVTSDGFEKALDFLYSGCVSCRAEELPDLLHTADRPSIGKLAGVCSEHLVKGLDTGNCIEMWQLYEGGPHRAISEAALGLALHHFRKLVQVSFACLSLPVLVERRDMPGCRTTVWGLQRRLRCCS